MKKKAVIPSLAAIIVFAIPFTNICCDRIAKKNIEMPVEIGKIFRDSETGMVFVPIPAGSFEMGSNFGDSDEKPVHQVYINRLWLGKFEVTQGQWEAVMGFNPSCFPKGADYPVEQVSWEDVQEFIRKMNSQTGLNCRLPTEAEWEYACRAGTAGERYGVLFEIAWYRKNSYYETRPVGQKTPNSWGLHDMLGNVWELCQDWHDANFYKISPSRNPQGPSTGFFRVLRGGSWFNDEEYLRCAIRMNAAPSLRAFSLGFRLAMTR